MSTVMRASFSPATGGAGQGEVVFDEYSFVPGCCDLAADGRALALAPLRWQQTATVVLNWMELIRGPK